MLFTPKLFRGAVAAMALVGSMFVAGCTGNLEERVGDLEGDVASLKQAVAALQSKMDSGMLVTSYTALPGNGGWKISFSDGTSIDIVSGTEVGQGPKGDKGDPGEAGEAGADGKDGVTPMIRVHTDETTGVVTIQYNVTEGYPDDGWVDTEADLSKLQGPRGPAGPPGASGGGGGGGGGISSVELQLAEEDGVIVLQYRVNGGEWTTVPVDGNQNPFMSGQFPIVAVIDNGDQGTVTFGVVMDGSLEDYTFAKAVTAVTQIQIISVSEPELASGFVTGETGRIVFRVNPSKAFVPLGRSDSFEYDTWILDRIDVTTRSAYYSDLNGTFPFTIAKDGEKEGQYTLDFRSEDITAGGLYTLALVFNAGTAEEPVLISSGTFTIGTGDGSVNDLADIFDNATEVALLAALDGLIVGDGGNDGKLSSEEAASITKLDVTELVSVSSLNELTSIPGIKYLTGLTELVWTGGALTEVDLTTNTKLTTIDLSGNPDLGTAEGSNGETLQPNFSKLPDLEVLDLSGSEAVTTPNLTNNPKLTKLDLSGTASAAPDLSANSALVELNMSDTDLSATQPDMTGLTALKKLNLRNSKLTAVDLRGNLLLEELDLSGNELASIDVTSNPNLKTLSISGNKLTSLDLVTGGKAKLTSLNVSDNELTGLDTSACVELVSLDVSNNLLKSQVLTTNTKLTEFKCAGNIPTNAPPLGPTAQFNVQVWPAYSGEITTMTTDWTYNDDGSDVAVTVVVVIPE